jgi:hypothetical protein
MKGSLLAAALLVLVSPSLTLDGQPGMHDPSTVVVHDGKFYVYATGNGLPKRLTLKKGPNVIRAAIVNAGGATDFCARFLDADNRPIKGIRVK